MYSLLWSWDYFNKGLAIFLAHFIVLKLSKMKRFYAFSSVVFNSDE